MASGVIALSTDPTAGSSSRAASAAPNAAASPRTATPAKASPEDSVTLSPQAKAVVTKLQARDADVRAHEQAHIAAGGALITSGVAYTYEQGPDGRMYAVGGDVSIDTSAVAGDPKATLAKALQIEAAALAPADPSSQDVAVAGAAAAMAAQASAQVAAAPAQQGATSAVAGTASSMAGAPSSQAAVPSVTPPARSSKTNQAANLPGTLINIVA
jgi:hypothetical protein